MGADDGVEVIVVDMERFRQKVLGRYTGRHEDLGAVDHGRRWHFGRPYCVRVRSTCLIGVGGQSPTAVLEAYHTIEALLVDDLSLSRQLLSLYCDSRGVHHRL